MRSPGVRRIRRSVTRLRNRFAPGVVVLLYHRVTELMGDPQWLAVPPAVFEQQMTALARKWNILSMAELASGLNRRQLPSRAVAITFDDGYADNAEQALPILERHRIPATFYIASGFVGGDEEIFSDELERLLIATPHPGGLLRVRGRSWDLPPLPQIMPLRWNVLMNPPPTPSHAAYRDLCAIAAPLPHSDRQDILRTVRLWAGAGSQGRLSHRFVSVDQLRAMAASPVVTLGAHTITHPRLAALTGSEQRREIIGSKQELERLTGRPITTFAYPFGGPSDQSDETVQITADAGFESACVNHGGSVRHGQSPHRINRILARDWPADELLRRVEEAFVE